MKRHLLTAGLASLAVLVTPIIATGAMAKPEKAATHHMKKVVKKTTPSNLSPTSTSSSATPATTPATPAKK
ncbi:MAG TPA: hypothetical protein VNS79_10595 [Sphingobium sp.]|nr:hypothetical protein [Sphingobium sp.]